MWPRAISRSNPWSRFADIALKCPRIVYTDLNGLSCKVIDASRRSADDLGRLEQEGWQDGEAQRLSGLQVDHQLEGGGLVHGKVGRLGALFEHVIAEVPGIRVTPGYRPTRIT